MWWYYKFVNLVGVLIQKSKVILFSMKKPCRRGSAPYQRSDWTSHLWGCPKNGLFKTTRVRRAPSLLLALWLSWTWLEHLWNSAKLRPPTRAPVRWTLTLKTNHLWSLRPCQSRKITEQRIQRLQSRELSRWRHAAEVSPKEHEPTTWNPKQRTHAGKRNQRIQPARNQQKASNKPTFLSWLNW